MLYWTSLRLESLIAILLSAALMGLSLNAAFSGKQTPATTFPRAATPAARAREKLLRLTLLVLLPLASYYWFVLRPAMSDMTSAQVQAAYALLVFQSAVGILGEVFLEFLKDCFGDGP